ncbi:MAG TPA: 50S ribosomal protein L23 [Anaerolineae bacterium]|nr:50S ribosomal protein L23 [Anaerolineae bacterium]HQH37575.1 50S ribosomal protein L23 [Anaerolineae bacterium]
MDIYEVIVRPLETEKAYRQREDRQYVFMVHRKANKAQVSHAVEEIYNVTVAAVNIMNMPAKINHIRGRRQITHRAAWKKAIVTLAPGESIGALEA